MPWASLVSGSGRGARRANVDLLHIIFLIAITAEAMSAAILGMRREMDLFGICLLGTVTGLGGGTVRDLLLNHHPISWVGNPEYLLFTAGAAVVTAYIARYVHRLRALFLFVDGLGLVAFTVIGCNIGLSEGVHPTIAILAGVITGIFGGLLRDIIVNEVPLVLRRDLYATVAFFTGGLYMGMVMLDVNTTVATIVALIAGFAFRLLALRFKWQLPSFTGEGIKGLD